MTGAGLRARWRGDAPLSTVFWSDMLVYGTALNAATTVAAMLLLTSGAPTALAVAVHFAPLPLNIFLFVAVWRSAEPALSATAAAVRFAAVLWLLAATAL